MLDAHLTQLFAPALPLM
jgi:hypothetical protein